MGLLRTGLLIAITILSTVFVVQNLASVEVSFLTWSITAPRALVFALLLLLGLLAGYLLRAVRGAFRNDKKAKPLAIAPANAAPSHEVPPVASRRHPQPGAFDGDV